MCHKAVPAGFRRERGVTLIEMALVVAITSLIVLVIGKVLTSTTRMTVQTDVRVKADADLRAAVDKIEISLLNANAFQVTLSTEVLYIADLNTDPGYDPNADPDGDGIPNLTDPDVDNDATQIQPSTAQWRVGYNLKDDDDDGDGKIDMRWRIYLTTRPGIANNTLYRDYSKDEEAWGNHIETLVTNLSSTGAFAFYGSRNDMLAPGTTGYDTNANGIVTGAEIDAVANGGNGDGQIDTAAERNAVVTVSVSLAEDRNRDGTPDSSLSTEVLPPLVYLKKRP